MHLFSDRRFALLFVGHAANSIGSWASLIAIWGYAAYRFDVGAGDIALLGMAWALPGALLGPVIGVPIDRFGPRRVLWCAYALGASAAIAAAFTQTYAQLVALGLLMGAVESFTRTANDALPPRLVHDDDLVAANALLGAADQSAVVFGPLVAAVAIAVSGVRAAFFVDALTFVIGAAVLLPLRLSPVEERQRTALWTEIVEGFRLARGEAVIRHTLLMSVAVFATWSVFMVIEPIYVREVLHESATVFALLQVAFGVGLVATSLFLSRLGDRAATPQLVAGSVLLSGLAAAMYVGTTSTAVAFVGVFLWGVDVAFFSTPSRTVIQRAAPPWAHGRVFSLLWMAHNWADVTVIPVAGLASAAYGVRTAGLVAAAAAGVAGTVGLARLPEGALEREDGVDLVHPVPASH